MRQNHEEVEACFCEKKFIMAPASCHCIELPPEILRAVREIGQRSCTGQLRSG